MNDEIAKTASAADQWLQLRKDAALKIDPETAHVMWAHGEVLDPYCIHDIRLGDEDSCIGRNYFACAPDSDLWVWFGDLPKAVRDRLWAKYKSKLTFPAGLYDIDTRVV